MHPDDVAVPVLTRHDVREHFVDLAIRRPVGGIDRHAIELVMEQRPEDPIGKPVVEAFDLVARQIHGDHATLGKLHVEIRGLLRCEMRDIAGPPDPLPAAPLVPRSDAGRQATIRWRQPHAAFFQTRGYGQSIRDDQQPAVHVST